MSDVVIINAEGDSDPEPIEPVVIVEPDDSPKTDDLEISNLERIVNLERDIAELRSQLWDAEGKAAWAQIVAEQAAEDIEQLAEQDEEIVEAIDEVTDELEDDLESLEEEVETEDNEPASAKVHPLFRPASDWFGGKS